MRRAFLRYIVVFAVLMLVSGSAWGITLKIATVTPEQSPWGKALNRMASRFAEVSNGQVRLQIFHNGIAGDEADVLRKIRIGQLHGGVLTSVGLNNLADEVLTLSMPLLIRSEDELDYVMEQVQPELEEAIRRNRFQILAWSKAGWIRFFADSRVETPKQLKELTLAVSKDNPELHQAFRLMGYQAIPISLNELLTALNSGMVDAFYSSPIGAAGYQWFSQAPYMIDLNVAPFLGGLVVSNRAWRRIPSDLQDELIEVVKEESAALDSAVKELEAEAIKTMKSYGLNVVELSDRQKQMWFEEFEHSVGVSIGRVFDEEMYELIQGYLEEYRR